MGTSLQTDRSDFRAAHLSGWSKNFAKGLLSNNNDFEVECWSIYDIKIYGYRGISVIEGGDSKWHYKGLQFKFFPSINIFNEPFSFELINTIKEEIKLGNKVIFHSQIMHNFMYILVSIITLVAIVLLLDTFKSPLTKIFPNLELFLFNLMESLKDIFLFIKNLLQ